MPRDELDAGWGASLLSNFSMAQELKEDRISLLELPGLPIKADWNLIWLKQKKDSTDLKAFIR